MSPLPRYNDEVRRRLLRHVLPGTKGNTLVSVRQADLLLVIAAADGAMPEPETPPELSPVWAEMEDL